MFKTLYYKLYKKTYKPDEAGEYSRGFWQAKVRKKAISLCRDVKGRFLEIGCGEGLFLVQMARDNPGLEIWGVDNDSQRIEWAGRRIKDGNFKNINLSLQDATNLSFENEYFDAVVCINVLLNLKSIEMVRQILGQMKRVCKKGGRIIFDFRNSLNPLLFFKYRFAKYYDATVKSLPLNTYKPKQIESILKDLNLNIVNKRFIGSFMGRFAPIIIIEAGNNA